jgi:hypothetical protein
MSNIGFSHAFKKQGASLKNVNWSVSAINNKNELVVSLWEHHRDKTQKGKLVFTDTFSRWRGPGNNEFRKNVTEAFNAGQNVRLIIVSTEKTESIQNGCDASTIKKSFRVRPELIGSVTSIIGDYYSIAFERE